MARIIEFEGRQIEVPDDATDEEIGQILGGEAAAPVPATPAIDPATAASQQPAAKEESWGWRVGTEGLQYLGGLADQAVRGAANGVVGIAALPQTASQINRDVSKWGLDKAGIPHEFGGVDVVDLLTSNADNMPSYEGMTGALDTGNNAIADTLGVERPRAEPDNTGERYVNKIGEFLGGAILPEAGMLATAERMGLSAVRQMPSGFLRNMLETRAVNPGRAIADETVANVAAGTGAATANSLVEPDSPVGGIAELFGAVGGVGLTGVARAGKEALANLWNAWTENPEYASQIVNEKVTDQLVRNSNIMSSQVDPTDLSKPLDTQELVDAIRSPSNIDRVIPGFQPTTADRAGDAGLALLEGARAHSNPQAYAARTDANANAVEDVFSGMAPKESPGTFRAALESEMDRRIKEAISGEAMAAQDAGRAMERVTPSLSPDERGSTIRNVLEENKAAAEQKARAAYDNVPDKMVDPRGLTEAIDQTNAGLTVTERDLAPQSKLQGVAALGRGGEDETVSAILGPDGNPIVKPATPPDQISLREAGTLRSELGRMKAAAASDWKAERGGNNAARVINQFQEQVDAFIGKNLTPEENAALDEAKAALKQMKDDFTRQGDPVAEALVQNNGGQYRVRDSMVGRKFIEPQALEGLFKRANSPQVRDAMKQELLGRGKLDTPERIAAFKEQYAPQLAKFPELVADLDAAAGSLAKASEAAAARTDMERTMARSPAGKYVTYGDENAKKAIDNVMAGPDPVKTVDELLATVGDDQPALEGFKAAFWKKLDADVRSKNAKAETKSGVMPVGGQKLIRFLDDPVVKGVMERLYRDDPEHLANLRELGEALKTVNTGKSVSSAANPSGTALLQKGEGITAAEIGSKLYQAKLGRISYGYIGAYLAQKLARGMVSSQNKAAFDMLLDKAVLDPETAAMLLKENNPANRAAMARLTKTWAASEAKSVMNLMAEDDSEDGAVKDAITREK
ncbi:MAG: hypothetical protein WC829_01950 [Hyphomicrobium sp.]|jgi:hypothetical protein